MVGVSVRVGVRVGVSVRLGVAVKTGVNVAVLVGVLEGVNVGVFTVGVAVGVDGKKVEGGTVTTMGTLTKIVRALFALMGFPFATERSMNGINLGRIGR